MLRVVSAVGSGEAPVPFVPCSEARFQNAVDRDEGEGINLARFHRLHTDSGIENRQLKSGC
jgi:hypothetical protein